MNAIKSRVSMKSLLSTAASLGFALALAQAPLGAIAQDRPGAELERILVGTKRQAIKRLDRKGLSVHLNDAFDEVLIEGWSTKPLTDAQTAALLDQFGVTVVADASKGTSYFYAPSNVGRAGILEGDTYLKLDGKIYKGLTLKGYGGNTVHGKSEQPLGSLDLNEPFQDGEVSTILAKNKVDTYIGIATIERPGAKANQVRISRTALRMEDFIRMRGADLEKLVDYMTNLLQDELGKKLTVAEFDAWLAAKTGDLMARKDYIRFQHGSVTDSNLGVGELVDLAGYGGQMRLPDDYRSQNLEFKSIARRVHENVALIDGQARAADFDALYDTAYEQRLFQLKGFDRARVNLNRATAAELERIGFTPQEAVEVVKYNLSTADGIIEPLEVATIKAITRDVNAILERATTDFMRLSDGTELAAYYVKNLGGADGVRNLLAETREFMRKNRLSLARDGAGRITGDVARVEEEVARLAAARVKRLGLYRAVMADSHTNLSRFIARQALEVIAKR